MGGEDGVGHPDKDAAGQVSWHHVVNMLKVMGKQRVAFEDRQGTNDAWRRVMVVVWDFDAGDAQLLDEQLNPIDEPRTPEGQLHLFEGEQSLQAGYGIYYRVPDLLSWRLLVKEQENEDEEDEMSAKKSSPALDDTSDTFDPATRPSRIVDMMRIEWKDEVLTVRTREGCGDTSIAATKVRVLFATPSDQELVLRSDLEAALDSGEAVELTEENDKVLPNLRPVDVLRADKHVIGTLYCEINWCFKGRVRVRRADGWPHYYG